MAWDVLYLVAMTLASPIWLFRLLRTGKWRTDWAARFGRGATLPRTGKKRLLIHAVSVGEINAIRSLVDALLRRAGDRLEIVVCATTDTGFARAKQVLGDRLTVVRYPLDFSPSVARFLDRVSPDVVALTELEVWPNFVRACSRRSIPVCVVNGRLTARSFAWYRRGRALVRPSFARLSAAAVQTQAYADRFRALGAATDRVQVLDTMKWDTAQLTDTILGADELARAMGIDRTRPLIVAGSTAPGEEELLLRTRPTDAQLMLVPRKPERFDEVAGLEPGIVRRTQCPDGQARPVDGQNVFLLDTIGELRKAYSLADVALVGRSFLGLYGSDPFESIGLGKPTIIGTHHSDFADAIAAFVAGNGIVVSDRPCEEAARLLADREAARRLGEAGRAVIRGRQGSTERHATLLLRLLDLPDF
ncbi:MAG: hypothetical protein NTW19_11380 [Planctomycetota bacterium]|nr:hypothetical protein [Planctomycetota bacterium]